MWGLRQAICHIVQYHRSIPTHVGFTSSICSSDAPRFGPSPRMWGLRCLLELEYHSDAVHPHACGVYPIKSADIDTTLGPSPRMWGLLLLLSITLGLNRSIPTHVGFTDQEETRWKAGSVHPHACGVYLAVRRNTLRSVGPSPRMWGLRTTTPASSPRSLVHPHACGVYYLSYFYLGGQ